MKSAIAPAVLLVSVSMLRPALGAPAVGGEGQRQPCADVKRAARLIEQHIVQVFMAVDATRAQIREVRALVKSSAAVERYRFLDKKAALKEFKRIFKDDPDLVKNVTAASLPTSFRVKVTDDDARETFAAAAEALSGVDLVQRPQTTPELEALEAQCAEVGED